MKTRSINRRWLFMLKKKAVHSPLYTTKTALTTVELLQLPTSRGVWEKAPLTSGPENTENSRVFSPRECNWWDTAEQHTHWSVRSPSKLLLGIVCAESTCFLSPIIFGAQLKHRLHANAQNVKRIQYTSLPSALGVWNCAKFHSQRHNSHFPSESWSVYVWH